MSKKRLTKFFCLCDKQPAKIAILRLQSSKEVISVKIMLMARNDEKHSTGESFSEKIPRLRYKEKLLKYFHSYFTGKRYKREEV